MVVVEKFPHSYKPGTKPIDPEARSFIKDYSHLSIPELAFHLGYPLKTVRAIRKDVLKSGNGNRFSPAEVRFIVGIVPHLSPSQIGIVLGAKTDEIRNFLNGR